MSNFPTLTAFIFNGFKQFGINSGKAEGGGRFPKGGLHVNSHNALGRCEKAPKIFSEGKPEAVGQRFA